MESFVWWLLPLFVLHEVEEIVWLPGWTERHRGELVARFPRIAGRLPRMSRGRIAWIAGEEGLLLSGLTGWSVASGDPVPWLVGFGGFSLHIGVHIGQWAVLRSYIPAIATSWICLPYCIWGYRSLASSVSAAGLIGWSFAGGLLAALNLGAMYRWSGRGNQGTIL